MEKEPIEEQKKFWLKKPEEMTDEELKASLEASLRALIFEELSEEEKEKRLKELEKERELLEEKIKLWELPEGEQQKKLKQLEEEAKKTGEEAVKLEEEAIALRAPEFYYATVKRRELEEKEKRRILTKECTELISYFQKALENKDRPKAGAILRKLAEDANENEILNYYGYPSTLQGLHDFFNEIMIKKLGMTEWEAYSLENDISYIAESRNHWELARAIKVEQGKFVQVTEEEHVIYALVEIRKIPDPRFVGRAFNRLAYGGETPRMKYNLEAGRDWHISALGIAICLAYGRELLNSLERKEFNVNAKGYLYEAIPLLEEAGVNRDFIAALKKFGYVPVEAETDPEKIAKKALEIKRIFGMIEKK